MSNDEQTCQTCHGDRLVRLTNGLIFCANTYCPSYCDQKPPEEFYTKDQLDDAAARYRREMDEMHQIYY